MSHQLRQLRLCGSLSRGSCFKRPALKATCAAPAAGTSSASSGASLLLGDAMRSATSIRGAL
eukprot:7586022-Pyramimonas_sp.AAC.1